MTRVTLIWFILMSLLATLVIWLFHGALFESCYQPFPKFGDFNLWPQYPLISCVLYNIMFALVCLIIAPLAITFVFYIFYVLIFNRPLPFTLTVLWLSWLVAFYFLFFEIMPFPYV
jgi:hypothetical protein